MGTLTNAMWVCRQTEADWHTDLKPNARWHGKIADMDIGLLIDFIALARTLNFTRAAEERHVTQSAFSRRIRALEQWVGVPLIDRSGFPLRLLPTGEEFLPVAKTVVIDLTEARDYVRSLNQDGVKFQIFSATHSISINRLPPLLRTIESQIPGIRTRVWSDDQHACCRLLTEGASDFLVCYRYPGVVLTLDEDRFQRIDLGSERLLPLCVPDDSGAPKWHVPGKSHLEIPLLGYAPGSYFGDVVQQILRTHRAGTIIRHLDAFAESLKSLALLGHGVAWLPEVSVADALVRGELVHAGDAAWCADLTLSVFSAPDTLDDIGLQVWNCLAALDTARRRHRR